MFVDEEVGAKVGGEPLMHVPHSSRWNETFLFVSVWLCEVMINTARHGKRLAVTMEGVVLVCIATVLGTKGWCPKKGGGDFYLIIIIARIIQELLASGKQIKPTTRSNQEHSKVLNSLWKGSHEKAPEWVQGDFWSLGKVSKNKFLINSDWPMSKLSLQTAAWDTSRSTVAQLCFKGYFAPCKTFLQELGFYFCMQALFYDFRCSYLTFSEYAG